MHKIHVRTGTIEVPGVSPGDVRPTHDQFIIPTGPNEEVVELEVLEAGWAEPPQGLKEFPRRQRKKIWRFRAVSVEPIEGAEDGDVIIEYEDLDDAVEAKSITKTTRGLLSRPPDTP